MRCPCSLNFALWLANINILKILELISSRTVDWGLMLCTKFTSFSFLLPFLLSVFLVCLLWRRYSIFQLKLQVEQGGQMDWRATGFLGRNCEESNKSEEVFEKANRNIEKGSDRSQMRRSKRDSVKIYILE